MFFRVKWLPWSPNEGSLFTRVVRGSIGESCQQTVHRTVARARFPIEKCYCKRTEGPGRFWKMRSAKCAQDCSQSSISHKKQKMSCLDHFWNHHHHHHHPPSGWSHKIVKTEGPQHFCKMRSTKWARDCSESSISHKNRKKLSGSEHFWSLCLHNQHHE